MTEPQNPYTIISAAWDGGRNRAAQEVEFVTGREALAQRLWDLHQRGVSTIIQNGKNPPLEVDLTVVPAVNIKPQIGGTNA